MSLKTSFFSKSIFKSDIKRFWWIAVLETLFLLFTNVLPLYRFDRSYSFYSLYWDGIEYIIMAVSIGIVAILFSHMHFSASVSTLHSFPVTRKCIYITKSVTGLLLAIVPVLLCSLFMLPKCIGGLAAIISVKDIFEWALIGVVYIFVIFSLATIVNVMTGNPVGTLVFTVGFCVLPAIFVSAFEEVCRLELYGYANNISTNFLEYIYVSPGQILKPIHLVTYLLFGVLMFIGGYFLYKKRALENYGEVIAFSWLKPVFIAIISVLTSVGGYLYLSEIFDNNNLLYMLPSGILGTAIAWMIARKSIRLKGILKPLTIYIVVALVFSGAMQIDISGFEKRIPKAEDVEEVCITDNYMHRISDFVDNKSVEFYEKDYFNEAFTKPEDIENIIEIHKFCIENRIRRTGRWFPIEYKLKNGDILKREYYIDVYKGKDVLRPVLESEQYLKIKFPVIDETEKTYTALRISDSRYLNENGDKVIYPDNEDFNKLIEALKLDVLNVTLEDMEYSHFISTVIYISYEKEFTTDYDIEKKTMKRNNQDQYYIRPSYVNTMRVLEEMGFFENFAKAEDISRVEVFPIYTQSMPTSYVSDIEKREAAVIITEPEKIAELYEFYDKSEGELICEEDEKMLFELKYVIETKNLNKEFYRTVNSGDEIPQWLEAYIK